MKLFGWDSSAHSRDVSPAGFTVASAIDSISSQSVRARSGKPSIQSAHMWTASALIPASYPYFRMNER